MSAATELAKRIRSELKAAGITARCRITNGAPDGIQVFVPRFDPSFTEGEQRAIRTMAVNHGLTRAGGQPVDVDRMTDPNGMIFYL